MSATLEQLLRDARIDLVLSRIEKDSFVINEVINQVDSDIRSIRFNSIFVLGELGDKAGPDAALKIRQYLNDNDWSIRREAARSLGKIGTTANMVIPELTKLMDDKEETIRQAVVTSLGKICNPTSDCLDALKEALKDSNIEVRTEAAKSLGLLGPDAYEVIPNLMSSMRDPNWTVRTASAIAISGIGKGTIKAIPTLINALNDEDWRVRYRVINTLTDIGEPAIPHLVNVLDHNDKLVRSGAVEALGELKISNPEILEKISNLLNDKDEQIRGKTADSLRSIGEPAVPYIIKVYNKRFFPLNIENARNIFVYLLILVMTLASNLLSFILPWLFGLYLLIGFIFVIMNILYGIFVVVDITKYFTGNYLWVFKIFDSNNKRRVLLLSSIGGIALSEEKPIHFVINQMKNTRNYIRVEVARTLGKIGEGSKDAVHALTLLLKDKKHVVRRETALSLGKLGSFAADAIPSLINVLGDKNKDVRWRATETLGKINISTEQIINALRGLIHDECDYVCEAADLAIDNLTENK